MREGERETVGVGGGGGKREKKQGYRQRKTKRATLSYVAEHTASTLIMDRRSLIVWAAMVLPAVNHGSFKPSSAASTVDIVLAK